MKFIYEPEDKNLKSILIKPRRVYECKNCVRIATRKDVNKIDGKYHCRVCGGEVEDITNRTTGKDFMEIVGR